jgi:hypothetical protein
VTFSDTEVTPHQAALARRIEEVVARNAEYERRELPSRGNGPEIEFAIRTTFQDLTVRIVVYQDGVHLMANGAWTSLEMVDPRHHERWAEAAVSGVTGLLDGPLRFRVRHTLVRSRPEGAIYLRYGNRSGWTGDLLASLGIGREYSFDDWYRRRSERDRQAGDSSHQ